MPKQLRIIFACILLLVGPTAGLVAFKSYERYQAEQQEIDKIESRMARHGEVLFFNASWCGPCRQMKPIVAQMKHQGYHMRDVDVDQNRALAQKYGVRGIPTFVFLENGKEIKRFSGGTSPENLRKLCSSPKYH